jgi:hypothetical protein
MIANLCHSEGCCGAEAWFVVQSLCRFRGSTYSCFMHRSGFFGTIEASHEGNATIVNLCLLAPRYSPCCHDTAKVCAHDNKLL